MALNLHPAKIMEDIMLMINIKNNLKNNPLLPDEPNDNLPSNDDLPPDHDNNNESNPPVLDENPNPNDNMEIQEIDEPPCTRLRT